MNPNTLRQKLKAFISCLEVVKVPRGKIDGEIAGYQPTEGVHGKLEGTATPHYGKLYELHSNLSVFIMFIEGQRFVVFYEATKETYFFFRAKKDAVAFYKSNDKDGYCGIIGGEGCIGTISTNNIDFMEEYKELPQQISNLHIGYNFDGFCEHKFYEHNCTYYIEPKPFSCDTKDDSVSADGVSAKKTFTPAKVEIGTIYDFDGLQITFFWNKESLYMIAANEEVEDSYSLFKVCCEKNETFDIEYTKAKISSGKFKFGVGAGAIDSELICIAVSEDGEIKVHNLDEFVEVSEILH